MSKDRIFIQGLPEDNVSMEDIAKVFSSVGALKRHQHDAAYMYHRKPSFTGKCTVTYELASDAAKAMSIFNRKKMFEGGQAHCRDGHGSFAHLRHRGEQEQGWTKQLTSDNFKETASTLGPTTPTSTTSPLLGQVQGEQVRPLPGLLPCLQLPEPLHGEETPSASGRDSRHLLNSP